MKPRELSDEILVDFWDGRFQIELTIHPGAFEQRTYRGSGLTRLGAIWDAYRKANFHERHKRKLRRFGR